LQLQILCEQLQSIVIEYVDGLDVGRASVKPASNRRSWNLQFGKRSGSRVSQIASRIRWS